MSDNSIIHFFAQYQFTIPSDLHLLIIVNVALILALTMAFLLYKRQGKDTVKQKDREIELLKEEIVHEIKSHNLLKAEVGHASKRLHHLGEFKAALDHLIGHDLKNTLNSMLGLRHDRDGETMKVVQSCGQLALSMLSNMLDVQRFEEEQLYPRLRHHCIKEVILEAKAQVQFLFMAKHLEMKVEIPEGVLVLIDKELMSRALVNLLVNAVKYSKVGTTISVIVRNVVGVDGAAMTEIAVEDQGEGITPAKLSRVFDRYWQQNESNIGRLASAGLGLVFCKHVLLSHDGSISAESELGKGTRFIMHIPFVEAVESTCNTADNTLSILRDELSISDEQLRVIRLHGKKLYELKVYEITKIREVIDLLRELDLKTTWTGELQMAVYQGNQKKYDELVEMIL